MPKYFVKIKKAADFAFPLIQIKNYLAAQSGKNGPLACICG
jgi:hypothetical protein